jgi:bacterioferritin-associated ferredoxin
MYICICNAIREKDLRNAARCHAGDAETLYEEMGHTRVVASVCTMPT